MIIQKNCGSVTINEPNNLIPFNTVKTGDWFQFNIPSGFTDNNFAYVIRIYGEGLMEYITINLSLSVPVIKHYIDIPPSSYVGFKIKPVKMDFVFDRV